jgi:hypothetical protein
VLFCDLLLFARVLTTKIVLSLSRLERTDHAGSDVKAGPNHKILLHNKSRFGTLDIRSLKVWVIWAGKEWIRP